MMDKRRISLRLEESLALKLDKISDVSGISVNTLIGDSIKEHYNKSDAYKDKLANLKSEVEKVEELIEAIEYEHYQFVKSLTSSDKKKISEIREVWNKGLVPKNNVYEMFVRDVKTTNYSLFIRIMEED